MKSSKGTPVVPTFRLPNPEDIPIFPDNKKSIFPQSFFPLLALAVLVFAMGSIVQLTTTQSTRTRSNAAGVDASLVFSGAPASVPAGSEFSVGMFLNLPTNTSNAVSALDATVTYSSNLEVVSVTPGAFFMENYDAAKTAMLNIIQTNTTGIVRLALGVPCTLAANGGPNNNQWWCYTKNTTGQVATLRFRVKPGATGAVTIGFDAAKTVAASTTNGNNTILNQTTLPTLSIPIPGTPTLTPTMTPTRTPTATPTPIVPTPTVGANSVAVSAKLRFRGINSATQTTARVIVQQGALEVYRNMNLPVSSDAQGVFTAQFSVPPGTYTLFVKSKTHLQKKYTLVVPTNGGIVDFSANPMLGGDVTGNSDGSQDGVVDIVDIGRVITFYDQVSPANRPCDINLDGVCELLDIGFMITNYDKTDEN